MLYFILGLVVVIVIIVIAVTVKKASYKEKIKNIIIVGQSNGLEPALIPFQDISIYALCKNDYLFFIQYFYLIYSASNIAVCCDLIGKGFLTKGGWLENWIDYEAQLIQPPHPAYIELKELQKEFIMPIMKYLVPFYKQGPHTDQAPLIDFLIDYVIEIELSTEETQKIRLAISKGLYATGATVGELMQKHLA